jgi:hypothetical protein
VKHSAFLPAAFRPSVPSCPGTVLTAGKLVEFSTEGNRRFIQS